MPFNGSGVFTRLYNWVSDRNANIKIRADRMDAEMDGFATGLSNVITRDGQTTVTAAIPMNNQKITGLGTPALSADAMNLTTAQYMAGWRNLVINSDFRINQRGFAGGALASGAYFYDRWKDIAAGSNVTVSGRVATVNSGAIAQVIEGASIRSGTHVINWVGTAACTVDGVSKAKGATFTLTAGTNCTVVFFTGTVAEVQIEYGTLPTIFEMRPIGVETALCQRYYCITKAGLQSPAIGSIAAEIRWPVEMRAAPTTAVITAGTLTNATVAAEDGGATTYGATFQITASAAGGFVNGRIRSHTAEL